MAKQRRVLSYICGGIVVESGGCLCVCVCVHSRRWEGVRMFKFNALM